jgi:AraC-like DNA-binding protein
MNVKLFLNRRRVLLTWLISYACVFLLPILLGTMIYRESIAIIENEINRSNDTLLTLVQQNIDGKLRELDKLGMEMSLNKRVVDLSFAGLPLTDDDHYQIFTAVTDLNVYKISNEFTDQVYVYYPAIDTVLTPSRSLTSRELFNRLRPAEHTSYEEWKGFYNKKYIKGFYPFLQVNVDTGEKAPSILYARSAALQISEESGAIIMFAIDRNKLLQSLVDVHLHEDSYVMILDQENMVITSSIGAVRPAFSYDDLEGKQGIRYELIEGSSKAISYTTSQITGWKYVTVTPAKVMFEKMEYLRNLTYTTGFLCIIIGIFLTVYSLRRNYNPILLLIDKLSHSTGIQHDVHSDEYSFINQAFNTTVAENEQIHLKLSTHKDAIRAHLLTRLLQGRIESHVPFHESFSANEIDLAAPYFSVMLFQIESLGKLETADPSEQSKQERQGEQGGQAQQSAKIRLVHFIVTNVVEELARQNNQAYMVEIDGMLACIVNSAAHGNDFPSEQERIGKELMRIAEQATGFMKEEIGVGLTVSISQVHEQIHGISQAYNEALESIEYRIVFGSREIIAYPQLADHHKDSVRGQYYYPLNIEQQLINFVKNGEYAKAKGIFDQIVEYNFSDTFISVPIARCLMFNFVSTMMKAINEMDPIYKGDFVQQINPIERLLNCQTMKDMQAQMNDVLLEVCGYIEGVRGRGSNRLSGRVMAFVQEHYANPDLNITMIGEHFRMTPSYLSRLFREETGEGLLDYMNKTRLEAAKRLLAEMKYSINEIAQMVGYNEINTFTRVFKKHEGITPSKYV